MFAHLQVSFTVLGHLGDNTLGEGALAHLRPRLLWEPSKTERVLLAERRDTQISGTRGKAGEGRLRQGSPTGTIAHSIPSPRISTGTTSGRPPGLLPMSDGASQFCPGIRGGQDRGMHTLSWAVPLLKSWGCPQTSLLTGILRANAGVWPESLGGNGGTRS